MNQGAASAATLLLTQRNIQDAMNRLLMTRQTMNTSRRLSLMICVAAAVVCSSPAVAMAQVKTPHRGAPGGGVVPHATAWCTGFRLGTLSDSKRLKGANLQRLRAAQAELAPGFAAGGARTGLDLLAGYQEQLERARPDTVLAANYLALVSTVPITLGTLRTVNALLCVSTTRAAAAHIVAAAEAVRQKLER